MARRHGQLICAVWWQVKGYTGQESLEAAVSGAQLVIIPAGVPRKPGMTRDDLFNINASIVKTLVEATAKAAPDVSSTLNPNPTLDHKPWPCVWLTACGTLCSSRMRAAG